MFFTSIYASYINKDKTLFVFFPTSQFPLTSG